MKQYNREKAVEYAQKYALSHNPQFYHFGGIGGDCTNYISQCLLAGGSKMQYDKNIGWYYNSPSDRSYSWTGVGQLQSFLLSPTTGGPRGEICLLSEIKEGDIIQLRQNPTHFNHTLFVSEIIGKEIYVCAHSNDALNKKLSSYQYVQILPIHILFADNK